MTALPLVGPAATNGPHRRHALQALAKLHLWLDGVIDSSKKRRKRWPLLKSVAVQVPLAMRPAPEPSARP